MQLGFGTAAIGRPLYINLKTESLTEPFDLEVFKAKGMHMLDKAYEAGIRYFDTAPGYGMAEEMLIDWISEKRDANIKIGTKWGYTYVADFKPNAKQHEVKEHSLKKLKEQWKQSKNLLPLLDFYQIHSATFETGVLENQAILEHLALLKEEFSIKIGLTTTGANQVDVLKTALEINLNNRPLFDTFQVTYNILDQSLSEILPVIKAQNKVIILKEALANGRLLPNLKHLHYSNLYTALDRLSKKYKVGKDAIALRFCIDSIQPDYVLSGASIEAHLSSNSMVNGFQLTKSEVDQLRKFIVSPIEYWGERKRLTWN